VADNRKVRPRRRAPAAGAHRLRLLRLGDVVRREQIDPLYVAYWGAYWQRFVPHGQQLPPLTPVHGWVAIRENERLFLWQSADQAPYAWLNAYQQVRRIGKSIWLYRIP
jgi:hypothetical protein